MRLTREQLIRRIQIIQEDLTNLYGALTEQGVDTTIENKKGSSVDTYATNIEVVCDIDKDGIPTDSEGHRVETEWSTINERKNK